MKFKNLTILISFFVFFSIAIFIKINPGNAFDILLSKAIYTIRVDWLTYIMKIFTYIGNWQSITLLCIFLLIIPSTRLYYGFPLSVSAIVSVCLQKILKAVFQRQRPDEYFHLIDQLGFSFPSGHSLTSLILFFLIIFIYRKTQKNKAISSVLTALLSSLILLIGFSRIYLGVHYPTDVLASWSLGLVVITIFINYFPFYKSSED